MEISIPNNTSLEKIQIDFLEAYRYFCPNFFFKFKDILDGSFQSSQFSLIQKNNTQPIEFIIGIDADTIFDSYCTINLLKTYYDNEILESKLNSNEETKTLVGVVGMVDINNITWWNLLVSYQYYEYMFAQLLKRRSQSMITNKVNCLSGCNQLIRVCEETCGNAILDDFNRKPTPYENIFNQIRSYASEDRNHICLMFKHYPNVRTVQSINAISYTNVPNNFKSLLRQRKRWCLGAFSNDLLLIINKHHHPWERINAGVNVLVFIVCPFIMVITIEFILTIIYNPTFLMLELSSIIILPIIYGALIPIIIYKNITYTHLIYYYIGMLSFYSWGIFLNLIIFIFSIWNIDDFQWNNKTIKNISKCKKNIKKLQSDTSSKHKTQKLIPLDIFSNSSRHSQFNNYDEENIEENDKSNDEENTIILERHSLLLRIYNLIKYGAINLINRIRKSRKLELLEIDDFVYSVKFNETVNEHINYTIV